MYKYTLSIICLLLLACNKTSLVEQVDLDQRNLIITTLNQYGISVWSKEQKAKNQLVYNLSVLPSKRIPAIEILENLQLLRKDPNYSELLDSSFMPDSKETKRYKQDVILAQELIDLVSIDPAIKDLRINVHYYRAVELKDAKISVTLMVDRNFKQQEKIFKEFVYKKFSDLSKNQFNFLIYLQKPQTYNVPTGINYHDGQLGLVSLVPFYTWFVPDGVDRELSFVLIVLSFIILSTGIVLGVLLAKRRLLQRVLRWKKGST